MDRKRLFLIDGSALYYRSYFAFIRNPLINSKGENTSAVFGFALYLMKIVFEEKPEYLAVVFDTKEPTFRHEMYDAYKATREKMPEDMAAQFPRIVELVDAFNIPLIDKVGYEADDIIGTLAKRAEAENIDAYMATADKDMMQLLSPHIKMYSMRGSAAAAEIIDEAHLMANLGLRPEQVIDYLALMGDSSDNVPGVPKVGKKTAQSLLQEFGSMENIYANLDKVTKKSIHTSLSENRELADLSKRLVTIDTNVPVEVSWDSLSLSPVDLPHVVKLYENLEFKTQIPRLIELAEGSADVVPTSEKKTYDEEKQTYKRVTNVAELETLAADLAVQPFWVFDTETTGLDAFISDIVGFAFSWEANKAWYVPLNDESGNLPAEKVIAALKPLFENPEIKKGGQNIKYDALMLHQHGISIQGIYFDTLIANFLVSSQTRQNKLDLLAEKYLNYSMIPIVNLIGPKGKNQKNMKDIPVDEVTVYACEDADITFQLKEILEKKLAENDTEKLFYEVEMPLVAVLLQMEINGVKLDVDFLADMSAKLKEDAERLRSEICEAAGEEFNVKSPKQLGEILFDKMKIQDELGKRKPGRTPTGQYKTAESDLLKFQAHPMVDKILNYREVTKLKSTYVDALPKLISPRTDRVHTSFSQTIAATGRLSSSDPNLQNIPIRREIGRRIRKAFITGDDQHVLLSADYSQVELRMMAHISGDESLQKAFENDEDIHSATAAAVFAVGIDEVSPDQRRKAKEINFGIIYGISRFGLAGRLGITAKEAEQIIMSYFVKYPKVNGYIADTIAMAREKKYVTTLLNRRRYINEIDSGNGNIRQNAERVAINTPIQGSAADLIKLAMINIHTAFQEKGLKSKMLLQVHDELVFEVAADELETVKSIVKEKMETAMDLKVPLKVDDGVGENWLEAH